VRQTPCQFSTIYVTCFYVFDFAFCSIAGDELGGRHSMIPMRLLAFICIRWGGRAYYKVMQIDITAYLDLLMMLFQRHAIFYLSAFINVCLFVNHGMHVSHHDSLDRTFRVILACEFCKLMNRTVGEHVDAVPSCQAKTFRLWYISVAMLRRAIVEGFFSRRLSSLVDSTMVGKGRYGNIPRESVVRGDYLNQSEKVFSSMYSFPLQFVLGPSFVLMI